MYTDLPYQVPDSNLADDSCRDADPEPIAALHTSARKDPTSQSGQASVEYALVLLGAALVASLLIAWATKTDLLNQLFDHVLNLIKGKAN